MSYKYDVCMACIFCYEFQAIAALRGSQGGIKVFVSVGVAKGSRKY